LKIAALRWRQELFNPLAKPINLLLELPDFLLQPCQGCPDDRDRHVEERRRGLYNHRGSRRLDRPNAGHRPASVRDGGEQREGGMSRLESAIGADHDGR